MALVGATETPSPEEVGVHAIYPGPVLVLAGPGTGKTHTLGKRVKWLVEDKELAPDEITLITFTVEAARNMRARLSDSSKEDVFLPREKQPRMICTMHSLGQGIIGSRLDRCGLREGFGIVGGGPLRRVIFEDAAQLVGEKRAKGRDADAAKQRAALRGAGDRVAQIAGKYDAVLRAGNAIDYDDQILLAGQLLSEDDELRAEYQAQAKHLLVDEYQDINADQFEFIRLLSSSSPEGLYVVGDDDQSIYGFRGGSPVYMQRFEEDFGAQASVKQLVHSWRCPSNVVNAAVGVVEEFNPNRLPKQDFTFGRETPGLAKVWNVPSDKSEAEVIARIAAGRDPSGDVLILVPSLDYAAKIRTALRRSRVAYELLGLRHRGGFEMFRALAEWLDAPDDNLALRDLLQRVIDGGSVGVPSWRVKKEERKRERETALGEVAALWNRVLSDGISLKDALAGESKNGGLATKLQQRLDELKNAYDEGLEGFAAAACRILTPWTKPESMLREIRTVMEELQGRGGRSSEGGVRIMTMRMAKGLEADTTIIVGLEEGGFPSDRDDVAEAARVLYVSMTRAKAELHLIHARRREGTATLLRESFNLAPCRFLGALRDDYCERQYIQPEGKRKKRKKGG